VQPARAALAAQSQQTVAPPGPRAACQPAGVMRASGFGEQGLAQSRDCAFHICTICRTSIRMSYFVPLFFGYQLAQILRIADQLSFEIVLWRLLQASGNQFILLLTVLCHEFGHGNMARYLGGDIDHILLWVFGGICFSSRARRDDNRKLLRDDLLVVAAGPGTHFLQAPLWGLVLWALFVAFSNVAGGRTGYESAWQAFVAALNPLSSFDNVLVWYSVGKWPALGWSLVGSAVQLNVALFLFNVFFPMYPADGSKLLVTSLMFCCGLSARRAANVLLAVSVPCSLLLIVWSAYSVISAFAGGENATASLLSGVMGFMGVMSLMEANKIWQLKKARRLNTHPLFLTARSWQREDRDAFGVVHRINNSDFDDDVPFTSRGTCREFWSDLRQPGGCKQLICGCSVTRFCCPCFLPPDDAGTIEEAARRLTPAEAAAQQDLRQQRLNMLNRVENQTRSFQKSVRQLEDERAAASQT